MYIVTNIMRSLCDKIFSYYIIVSRNLPKRTKFLSRCKVSARDSSIGSSTNLDTQWVDTMYLINSTGFTSMNKSLFSTVKYLGRKSSGLN